MREEHLDHKNWYLFISDFDYVGYTGATLIKAVNKNKKIRM